MEAVLHPATHRGAADFGWLNSHHSFSFGQWFNPDKIHFGALRVLNDDIVQPSMGFGTHPHDNMEIISIPLEGTLAHKDSTGRQQNIETGEVQIMSAGTGLTHSEFNASNTDTVNFLQIWILPKERNIKPQYDQRVFDAAGRDNQWQLVVAPDNPDALWINQDAYLSLANLSAGKALDYQVKKQGNGVYFFLMEGAVQLADHSLARRDAVGLSGQETYAVSAKEDSYLLAIEVPMLQLHH